MEFHHLRSEFPRGEYIFVFTDGGIDSPGLISVKCNLTTELQLKLHCSSVVFSASEESPLQSQSRECTEPQSLLLGSE